MNPENPAKLREDINRLQDRVNHLENTVEEFRELIKRLFTEVNRKVTDPYLDN